MSFQTYIESLRSSWRVGSHVETIYGTSTTDQSFAVLITKVVWYAIRVIMDEDHRDKKGLGPQSEWVIHSQHRTLAEARKKANYWKEKLESGEFWELYLNKSPPTSIKKMPSDCATNPDNYLKPGDLIQRNFYKLKVRIADHEGIYIGNGQVVHVSNHGDGDKGIRVRLTKLNPNFVTNDSIRVKVFRIRFREVADIVAEAKRYADSRFCESDYNLLLNNCQHFATFCTVGWERCSGFEKFLIFLLNGVAPFTRLKLEPGPNLRPSLRASASV